MSDLWDLNLFESAKEPAKCAVWNAKVYRVVVWECFIQLAPSLRDIKHITLGNVATVTMYNCKEQKPTSPFFYPSICILSKVQAKCYQSRAAETIALGIFTEGRD